MGPHGFTQTEMGGFSDNFAFTDVDVAQAHSFFGFGSENENTIFTAPEETIKINDVEQQQRTSSINSTRCDQDKEHSDMMKRGQINAVIEAEQQQMSNMSRSQQLRMQKK